MRKIDWEPSDVSFRIWGICIGVASAAWIAYYVGFGSLGPGSKGVPWRTIAWCLSAPVVMIGIFAFRLGRRQARRRRERRERS